MKRDNNRRMENTISLEEYLKRRKAIRAKNKNETNVYSFELSFDSFLESFINSVNP